MSPDRRIFLNGRSLLQPLTGVQRCVHEWARCLQGEVMPILPPKRWSSGLRGHLWEQVRLPGQIKNGILWSPANVGPLKVSHQVVTMHDAATLDHPEWFSPTFANLYRHLLPLLAKNTLGIITVSQFSKERLVQQLKIADHRIHVVPNGVSSHFCEAKSDKVQEVLRKHAVRKPYFICVGSIDPRKNIASLIAAWGRCGLSDYDLLIVGSKNSIFEGGDLDTSIPGVCFLGRVSNEELVALYSGAHAFLSTSLYEGFGLPTLEAMACGTPCIISDIPAHREIGGRSPLYVLPTSQPDWVDAIRESAQWSSSERERRKKLGVETAACFTWEVSALTHLNILRAYAGDLTGGPTQRQANIVQIGKERMSSTSNSPKDRIKILGSEYLLGRKLSPISLAFLVLRDLTLGHLLAVRKREISDLEYLKEICICKIDHLGDLLIATPFIKAVRQEAPYARITLIACRTSMELADILREQGLVDRVLCYSPFLTNRSTRSLVGKIYEEFSNLMEASRVLKSDPPDVFFDLRLYSPSSWVMAILSRAQLRIGFGLRGMSRSYHDVLSYQAGIPFGQVLLDALPTIGKRNVIYQKPLLDPVLTSSQTPEELLSRPFIALQLDSGETLRNIETTLWRDLISKISVYYPVVLIGTQIVMSEEDIHEMKNVFSLVGKSTLRKALNVILNSSGVISVDSFAAHVGLAYDKPVAVLMKMPYSNPTSYPTGNRNLHLFEARSSAIMGIVEMFRKTIPLPRIYPETAFQP